MNSHPIREEWEEYYLTLEGIRRTGCVNMWGANIVLNECYPSMSKEEAKNVLLSWITNYGELNEKYGWQ